MLRTRIRVVHAVVILVLAAALALPAGVGAAEPSTDRLIRDLASATDPAAAFSDLSPAQQRKVLAQLQVVEITTDAPAPSPVAAPGGDFSILAGGCWTVTRGDIGQWLFRAHAQAHFQLNVVCPVQHGYPWLDMTVTANGGLTGSGGGS